MDTTREFKLTDADGVSHDYVVTAMEPEEGVLMMLHLSGLACGPLGVAIGGVVKNARGLLTSGQSLSSVMDDPKALGAVWTMIEGLDFGVIFSSLGSALLRPDAAATVKKLMHLVHRDSRPMREAAAFDAAYKANYWELMRCVVEVIRANRFFPQLGISPAELTTLIPVPTEQPSSGPPTTG